MNLFQLAVTPCALRAGKFECSYRCTAVSILAYLLAAAFCISHNAAAAEDADAGGASPSDAIVEVFSSNTPTGELSPAKLERLPVHIVVSLDGGYEQSNGSIGTDAADSLFAHASLELTYAFHGSRLQGSLATGTSMSYYFDRSDNAYEPNAHLDLSLGYAVNERLSLSLSSTLRYQSQPDLSLYGTTTQRNASFWYMSDSLSATYVWLPRISTVTSYSFSAVRYDDSGTISRDHIENGGGQGIRFLLLPMSTVTADYRIQVISYDQGTGDAVSQSALVGIDQTLGPRLNGTLRVGVQFYSDNGDTNNQSSRVSPQVESSLSYVLGARTSLSWSGGYSIEPSDSIGSSGQNTLRTGLQVTYGVTQRISMHLGGNYTHRRMGNSDPSVNESTDNSFDVSLGAAYTINSLASLTATYQHTQLNSDVSQQTYTSNRYLLGLTLSF